ncbi:MAG: hypothetical protein AMDU5_GPLC00002G0018 [Thermoplasmatales archaeon Gpl]|nr:MAG: hypothetical protein AMDU5_GPLC00002G0018 [Thermoplasmatales archaeon Gpl]
MAINTSLTLNEYFIKRTKGNRTMDELKLKEHKIDGA